MRGQVRSARSVAAFTTSAAGRQIAGSYTFEMRVLIEVKPDVCMARFAGVTAHVSTSSRCAGILGSATSSHNCQEQATHAEYHGLAIHDLMIPGGWVRPSDASTQFTAEFTYVPVASPGCWL